MRWLYSFGAEKVDELKAFDFDFAVKSLSACLVGPKPLVPNLVTWLSYGSI